MSTVTNHHISDNVGPVLRIIRELRGLSRGDVCARADIHVNTLQRIETGDASPNVETVTRITAALDVSPSLLESLRPLMTEDGKMSPEKLIAALQTRRASDRGPVPRDESGTTVSAPAPCATIARVCSQLNEDEQLEVLEFALRIRKSGAHDPRG